MSVGMTFAIRLIPFLVFAPLRGRLDHLPELIPADQPPKNLRFRPQAGKARLLPSANCLSAAPFLRLMLLAFAVWPVGGGIFNILISVYAVEVFHQGDLGIGILYGALGAVLVLGSGLTGKFAGHIRTASLIMVMLEGIFYILISQSESFTLTGYGDDSWVRWPLWKTRSWGS